VLALCAALLPAAQGCGRKIGTVDTAFQWIGRDHDIIVEAYDDPACRA
jgi:CreA protein